MEKLYKKIGWKNKPNLSTPLGATNLKKIDEALDGLDNRTIELNSKDAEHSRHIEGLYAETRKNAQAIESSLDALKIIPTASGTTAYMDDASNMNLENIIFYGESKQNGTPTPTSPIPIESKVVNRIDVLGTNQLPNELKSRTESGLTIDSTPERIKVTGTTLRGVTVSVCDTKIESKKGLFAKGATKLEGLSYVARVHNYSTGAMEYWVIGTKGRYVEPGWTIERVYIQQTNADVTVDAEIQPQIVVGNVDLPFEPYQSQTVNLSAPIELNGFGGVRDTDKLKKFGVVVLDGSNDEVWSFNELSQRLMLERLPIKRTSNNNEIPNILCTQFLAKSPNQTFQKVEGITVNTYGVLHIYSDNFNTSDISLWKAHLQANPMTVVYELAEPIETELPQADINAIKALHSYKPNTIVMNDGAAEMNVHYVADAKTYIDKKFETLAKAIVNQ